MKILGRILIILTAALVVVGVTMALAGNNDTGFSEPGRHGPEQFGEPMAISDTKYGDAEAGDSVSPGYTPGRPPRHGSAGLFGIGEIFKNLVIIGVVVLLVKVGGWSGRALARSGRRPHNTQ